MKNSTTTTENTASAATASANVKVSATDKYFTLRAKYSRVGETAIEYIKQNKLTGTYGEIAKRLNEANIATKRNVAWSAKSVERLHISKPSTSDLNDKIDSMLEAGVKYTEIAKQLNELGFTTKQGKKITEMTIKNYVGRKK